MINIVTFQHKNCNLSDSLKEFLFWPILCHWTFSRSCLWGELTQDRFGMNLARYVTMLMTFWSACFSLDSGISWIALSLFESGFCLSLLGVAWPIHNIEITSTDFFNFFNLFLCSVKCLQKPPVICVLYKNYMPQPTNQVTISVRPSNI